MPYHKIVAALLLLGISVALFAACDTEKSPAAPDPGTPVVLETVITSYHQRDYENAEGRIYDLGTTEYWSTDSVADLIMFEANLTDPSARPAKLRVNTEAPWDPYREVAPMKRIDMTEYEWFDDPATNRHCVVFRTPHNLNALAYYMTLRRNTGGGYTSLPVGDTTGDTLILRKIRSQSNYDAHDITWNLMWRNVYAVPQGQSVQQLNFRVFKGAPGTEGTDAASDLQETEDGVQNYMRILGLDQFRPDGQRLPDDILDDRIAVYRADWGLVIFPHRTPFDTDTTFVDTMYIQSQILEDRNPNIYNYFSQSGKTTDSKYFVTFQSWTIRPRE